MHQNLGDAAGAADILSRDVALFRTIETGAADHLYCCWHTLHPIVVAGRYRRVADDVNEDACRADGVPVIHRESGGGTVVLGAGCLNYALATSLVSRPALADVAMSFRLILDAIATAVAIPGLIRCETDLTLGGRKVGGSAQRRGRRALLHHGTLLFGFDAALATRYLREPARQPVYRRGRSHADFLGNIPLEQAALRERVEGALRALHAPHWPALETRA